MLSQRFIVLHERATPGRMWLLPLTRSRENCTTCSTRIASFCLLLVGWLLRTRVGQPSKARGERATYGNARPGGGTGRRSSRTHTASEYEGPGLRVPVTQISFSRKKHKTEAKHPPGATPTQGAHAESDRERGLAPDPGRRSARLPKGARRLRERRKKEKLR